MNKKILTFLLLSSLLISSCSLFVNNHDDEDTCGLISFSVANFENQNSERTLIIPENITPADVDKFILNGARNPQLDEGEEDKNKIVNKEFSSYSELTTYEAELYYGTWNFTLEAYKGVNKIAEASINSYSLNNNSTITFALEELATGSGSYEISVYFPLNGAAKVRYKVDDIANLSDNVSGITNTGFTTVNKNGTDYSCSLFGSSNAPKGYYFLRLYFYSDAAATKLISQNTVYFRVAPNYKTTGYVILDNINTPYSIIYKNDDGTDFADWNPTYWNGLVPKAEYNSSMDVVLPIAQDIYKPGFKFLGWYTKADATGVLTTGWGAGTTGNQTVYAKWEPLYNLSDGAVAFKEDDITIDISRNTAKVSQETTIAVTVTKDKGTAAEKKLYSTEYSDFKIYVYAAGQNVTSKTNFTVDYANNSIKLQDLPAGEKLVLYVSLRYNGKAYGGSFQIDVIKTADVSLQNLSSYLAALGPGEYTIAMDTDMSVDQNVTDLAAALKANPDVIVNLNMKGAEFTEFAGASVAALPFLYEVTNLKTLELPDTLTSIKRAAFNNCKGLTSITIPDSVTSIGDYAFNWCTALSSVTFEDQTHSWDIQATQGTSQSPAVTFTPTANASANAIALKTTYNSKYWSKIE